MKHYIGLDPGGKNAFGWCVALEHDKHSIEVVKSGTCSEPCEAVSEIIKIPDLRPISVGIDSPLYWVMSNERVADNQIRTLVKEAGGHSSTVGHVNSLRGACLVQGILSAVQVQSVWTEIKITESHPKALLAVHAPVRKLITEVDFQTEHERDAFLGAYASWYSIRYKNMWTNWVNREEEEIYFPTGFQVAYWFPGE